MNLSGVRGIVPRTWKTAVKRRVRSVQFSTTVRDLSSISNFEAVDRGLLERVRLAWGNQGFSADTECLADTLREASRAEGPILECGSGLSTLLMGIASRKQCVDVYALEHHPEWADRTRSTLDRFGIDHVRVITSALENFGEFSWYGVAEDLLPARFAMVLCDGPPGNTPGGRYGLLPVLGSRLRGAVIVMDDAHRPEERLVLERWEREAGWDYELIGEHCPHAIIRCPE